MTFKIGYDNKTGESIPSSGTGGTGKESDSTSKPTYEYITPTGKTITTTSTTARVPTSSGYESITSVGNKNQAGAGAYFDTGVTGKVGYASGAVDKIVSGTADKGFVTYNPGSNLIGGVPLPTRVTQQLPAGVPVSAGVYNKVINDEYGVNSPHIRATPNDYVTLSTNRPIKPDSYELFKSAQPLNNFKFGISSLLPAINERINRRNEQEQFFTNLERGTATGMLRGLGDKTYSFSERLRSKAENVPEGYQYSRLRGSLGMGALGAGYASALLKLPSEWSRDVVRFESTFAGGYKNRDVNKLFTTGEKISGGINTVIRSFVFVYSAGKGAGIPSSGKIGFFDKSLITAGGIGVGLGVYDIATTRDRSERFAKSYRFGAEITGIVGLGMAGSKLGSEFNPYTKLLPSTEKTIFFNRGGSGSKVVSGNEMVDVNIIGKNVKNGFIKTNYEFNVQPGTYTIGKGKGYFSTQVGEGKTYFTTNYKGLFNNFYGRGTVSNEGVASINFYRGDVFKGSYGYKTPNFYLSEAALSLSARQRVVDYDFTREFKGGINYNEIIGSKDVFGGFKTTVKSDLTAYTPNPKISNMAQNRFYFDWFKGERGNVEIDLIPTKYVFVDYIPKNKGVNIIRSNNNLIIDKPSFGMVNEKITWNQKGYVTGKNIFIDLSEGSGGLSTSNIRTNKLIEGGKLVNIQRVPSSSSFNIPKAELNFGTTNYLKTSSLSFIPTFTKPFISDRVVPKTELVNKLKVNSFVSNKNFNLGRTSNIVKPINLLTTVPTTKMVGLSKSLTINQQITTNPINDFNPGFTPNINIIPSFTPNIIVPPPPPPPTIPFGFPGGSGGRKFFGYSFLRSSRLTRYVPSYSALFFGLKGSYKPGKLSKSGLDYRPITPGYKLIGGDFKKSFTKIRI